MNHLPGQISPGGDYKHMHAVLDGLGPHAAMAAIAAEFPGYHPHLSEQAAVWAEVPGGHLTLRAQTPELMWQAIAAFEFGRHAPVTAFAGSTA